MVYDAIAEMAPKDKMAWVHFRNVRGKLLSFAGGPIDESDGDIWRQLELSKVHAI